jgi:hypothetical protein
MAKKEKNYAFLPMSATITVEKQVEISYTKQ